MSREAYEQELQGASLEKRKQIAIVNTTTAQLMGGIYLRRENDVYWLGYPIHPLFARGGYAKEAVGAMIRWIADRGGSMVQAGVLPENIASIKLLEKMNFPYVAKEDDELIYMYHLLKAESVF